MKALSAVNPKTQQQVLELLNEIVAEFERRHYVYKKIKYGEQVPAYFANVVEQSKEERQYLSLVGIRNLLKCGAGIVDDFSKQRFLGGEHHYAWNQGLKNFKFFTGNVVDLDIEIDAANDAEAIKEAEEKIVNFGKILWPQKAWGWRTDCIRGS